MLTLGLQTISATTTDDRKGQPPMPLPIVAAFVFPSSREDTASGVPVVNICPSIGAALPSRLLEMRLVGHGAWQIRVCRDEMEIRKAAVELRPWDWAEGLIERTERRGENVENADLHRDD